MIKSPVLFVIAQLNEDETVKLKCGDWVIVGGPMEEYVAEDGEVYDSDLDPRTEGGKLMPYSQLVLARSIEAHVVEKQEKEE